MNHVCADGFTKKLTSELTQSQCLRAGRDKKGAAFILLVPLLAISLVMLILSINIDPSSPNVTLRIEDMLPADSDVVPLSHPPSRLGECADVPCAPGHKYDVWDVEHSSYNMSEMLLEVWPSACGIQKWSREKQRAHSGLHKCYKGETCKSVQVCFSHGIAQC